MIRGSSPRSVQWHLNSGWWPKLADSLPHSSRSVSSKFQNLLLTYTGYSGSCMDRCWSHNRLRSMSIADQPTSPRSSLHQWCLRLLRSRYSYIYGHHVSFRHVTNISNQEGDPRRRTLYTRHYTPSTSFPPAPICNHSIILDLLVGDQDVFSDVLSNAIWEFAWSSRLVDRRVYLHVAGVSRLLGYTARSLLPDINLFHYRWASNSYIR